MSKNNGTGFWVVVALIAAMSVAVLIEAVIVLVSRALGRSKSAAPSSSRNDRIEGARA